ncbi:MAG TPA: PilZ domain-containing protein [Pirellulales bacterium]|nr:PilZ domain-containing protein [Pirellulales bacterium]
MRTPRLEGAPKSEAKLRVRMALRELVADKREQRRERRIPYLDAVTISPVGVPAEKLSAFARDLAPGGIGLVHMMPLEEGEIVVTIRLPRGRTADVLTHIVWCREFADGWFASGGRFVDVLEGEPN